MFDIEEIFPVPKTEAWKGLFIHTEAESMPGLKVYLSTFCDVRTTMKLPNVAFLRTYPRH
jgi:hypothetical protein